MSTLPDLLKRMVEKGGSDLHLTTNTPPQIRIDGELQRQEDLDVLAAAETKQLIYSVLTDGQKRRFEESKELDFSFGIRGMARFRCNVFNQRGAVGAVYRVIPEEIKSVQDLGLPAVVAKFGEIPRGLVLVTGPTGSGKSTTLAALLDKVNVERHGHILTIEDPIEYVHQHKSCVVNQREVHSDTDGFSEALRAALREDPDVVLIGEDARPRDHRGGAQNRRDRPSDVRDPAHELGRADDQPDHRRFSRPISKGRSAQSCHSCSKGSCASHWCRRRADKAVWPRWRSWCRHPPSAT